MNAVGRALRLEPHPPAFFYWIEGFVFYCNRRYEDAVNTLRRPEVYGSGSRRILAAALAQSGDLDEARREGALFRAMVPGFRISRWVALHAYGDAATLAHYAEGCRMAGLPE